MFGTHAPTAEQVAGTNSAGWGRALSIPGGAIDGVAALAAAFKHGRQLQLQIAQEKARMQQEADLRRQQMQIEGSRFNRQQDLEEQRYGEMARHNKADEENMSAYRKGELDYQTGRSTELQRHHQQLEAARDKQIADLQQYQQGVLGARTNPGAKMPPIDPYTTEDVPESTVLGEQGITTTKAHKVRRLKTDAEIDAELKARARINPGSAGGGVPAVDPTTGLPTTAPAAGGASAAPAAPVGLDLTAPNHPADQLSGSLPFDQQDVYNRILQSGDPERISAARQRIMQAAITASPPDVDGVTPAAAPKDTDADAEGEAAMDGDE